MGTNGLSITLANSIIGVGILAMPFCFQQCGVLLATLILITMGLVSRLCSYFLLKSALLARRRTYEFLAFHVFGPVGKLVVEICIIGFLMGTCIAYFVVVGDLGPQIIAKLFNINQSDILRTSIMVIVSLVCVLPLGLLRNVDSLSNVSAATIGFYFCLVMKVIVEAGAQLVSGPVSIDMWKPAGVLQCVPIFSMALFCQTQLFEIFDSMPSLSLEKMNLVTKNAINICTGVYFTLGLFGYIAFSSQDISGNILMSLSPTMANDVIKLGFVMSLAFSFPLIIFPCRASLYSFLYRKVHHSHHDHIINHSIPETTFRCITIIIIISALIISLLVPNIELVLGLSGSTIGAAVCVVFPAACFIKQTFKNTSQTLLAKIVLVLGLFIIVLGTYANLEAAENKLDRYDDKVITQEKIDKIVEDFFEKMDKSDGLNLKPVDNNIIATHNVEASKGNNEPIKDSEVQPPNPIPPESNSNEKLQKELKNSHKNENILRDIDILLQEQEESDKVPESHPKNLKSKLNGSKTANGGEKPDVKPVENKIVEEVKDNKPSDEVKHNKVQSSPEKTQEKIDILKQQQLIETIKQHGEEQKELIKEQKEILDEIKKTKNEMHNQKQVDSEDAKKIAVESIQKIANMAIQSLSGVTDKPVGNIEVGEKKSVEKIANEAVQEIAKKAVETIEAIKEIKDKPNGPTHLGENGMKQENKPELVSVNNNADSSIDIQAKDNLHNAPLLKIQPNAQNEPLAQLGNNNIINPEPVILNNQKVNDIIQPNNNDMTLNKNNDIKLEQVDNNDANNNQKREAAVHSHSPDEPQSYKQGEDLGMNRDETKKNGIPNVPLALALNGKSVQNQAINGETNELSKHGNNDNVPIQSGNNIQNGAVKTVEEKNQEPIRQKREVVDCSEKMPLKPEDKEVCEKLVGNSVPIKIKDMPKDILDSKVDLNEALSKSLPVDNVIYHLRSLKSYDELKER